MRDSLSAIRVEDLVARKTRGDLRLGPLAELGRLLTPTYTTKGEAPKGVRRQKDPLYNLLPILRVTN
jgi:hypothetical protein